MHLLELNYTSQCTESLQKGRVNMAEHMYTGLNRQAPWPITMTLWHGQLVKSPLTDH